MKKYLFLISFLFASTVNAATIVDHSNGGYLNGNSWSNRGGAYWTVWDDFNLSVDSTITGIDYFTRQTSNVTADYTLMIGTQAGLSDIFSTTISNASATQTFIGSKSKISASFSPLNLSAGIYWLTFNSPANLWGSSNVSGESLIQISGNHYTRFNNASSFILTGSNNPIPEPTSLALLSLGLVGFGFSRKTIAHRALT